MINRNVFITNNSSQTRKLGEMLAKELHGGGIICLTGELGSGKTTFAQGVLAGLGAKGPYTSPTFVVIKHYKIKFSIINFQFTNNSKISKFNKQKKYKIQNIYHIDAYRVRPKDILDLGWEEIVAGKNNMVLIEWAEKIRGIIPRRAVWVKFEHLEGNKRKITVK